MPSLMDAIDYIGGSLDKPGRAVRGLLGGDPGEALAAVPFSDSLGLTDPANAVSGSELLRRAIDTDPNSTIGQVGGFAAEVLLDPTNLIGGMGLARRGISAVARGAEAHAGGRVAREAMLARGAMPAEAAAATKVVDEAGRPLRTYHGSSAAYDKIDPAKFNAESMYGPGYYATDNPQVAGEYAQQIMGGNLEEKSRLLEEHRRLLMDAQAARSPGRPGPARVSDELRAAVVGRGKLPDSFLSSLEKGYGDPGFGPGSDYVASHLSSPVMAGIDQAARSRLMAELEGLAPGRATGDRAATLQAQAEAAKRQAEAIGSNANTRSQYLDIRNPFDINVPVGPRAAAALDAVGPTPLRHLLSPHEAAMLNAGGIPADRVYEALAQAAGGKRGANDLLRRAGYDGIAHTGGANSGGVAHQVYVALDPGQVYKPWLAPAVPPPPSTLGSMRTLTPFLAAIMADNTAARGWRSQ